MKTKPLWKCLRLALSLLAWLGLSFALLIIIITSDFELDLDFNPLTPLLTQLGLVSEPQTASLTQPMIYMLLGASGATLVLILLQFAALLRRKEAAASRQLTLTAALQLILGAAAAALLTAIGVCLQFLDSDGILPLILGGLLWLRLAWHLIRSMKTA